MKLLLSKFIPAKRAALLCVVSLVLTVSLQGQETAVQLLSGSGSDDTVDWEFRLNGGRKSGEWSTIPVPSNWEMQGFGTYRYWSDWGENPAPDSLGEYRYVFEVPAEWSGRSVDIVFGGAMTDTDVFINGVQAGPTHQGGFYEFRYEITDLLKFGQSNQLEARVRKFSENKSVNEAEREADYWLFGGIFRPVWLEASPADHIERVAVDARANGDFSVELFLSEANPATAARVEIVVKGSGKKVASFTDELTGKDEKSVLKKRVAKIKTWSAESPILYVANISILEKGKPIHKVQQTFGFRTIEVRPKDGIYVNGKRVILKGVNRHTFWPTSGRATNASLSVADIKLMKEMNMNAVRMSHYPPDRHFLDAADELGIYVIDELAGWQKAYDAEVGARLVRETVIRDVNHPSVIFWANGNEGGYNRALDGDYARYDPQGRTVIHPWLNTNGVNTSHYERYDTGVGFLFHGDDIVMPTEFLHALYDGGGAAGLDDWWSAILKHPAAGGGFIWAFADEGIVRDDKDGRIDVAGNSAPDGVVGPYREKEGSFEAIREIWSPVYLPLSERDRLSASFDGKLIVENRYDHTNLKDVSFSWRLMRLEGGTEFVLSDEGVAARLSVEPKLTGELSLDLPKSWRDNDLLELSAAGPSGAKVYTWTWMLSRAERVADSLVESGEGEVQVDNDGEMMVAAAGDVSFFFDAKSGLLKRARKANTDYPLNNGPVAIDKESSVKSVSVEKKDGMAIIRAQYDGGLQEVVWTAHPSGWLQLDYGIRFGQDELARYVGVSFDYPEENVTGVRYLGKGPYRVWKNRRKGAEYGVWEKGYNDTATGASWVYPEFKGFHEDLYWATLQSDETPVTIVSATDDLFLGLFSPSEGPEPRTTHVAFPEGDISFLHGIAPIGTKFHPAEAHGPQGAVNIVRRHGEVFRGRLYFHLD